MEHTLKSWKVGFLIWLLTSCFQVSVAQVQDKLREKVEKENPPKPAQDTSKTAIKPDGTKTQGDTSKPNANGNGQAPFTVNGTEIDPKSLGQANTMVGKAGAGTEKDKDKDVKIEENVRVIDTVRFKERILVKKRDTKLYDKGLGGNPISHRNTDHHKYTIAKDKYVFGWHPHWVGEAYKSYNFSVLNVLAYYSYEVEPSTGDHKNLHDWYDSDIVRYAHNQNKNCKVLLSISNIGKKDNETFLQNSDAQSTLIRKAIKAVQDKKANGVHLDFEEIPASQRDAFSNFVIDFASKLRAEIKDAFITIALPPLDFEQAFDVRQLSKHANLLIINGSEFYGSNTDIAGPVSQIKGGGNWWNYSLERAVDEYIAAGVEPHKLLLGVSYYGAEWVTADLKTPSKSRKFVKYLPYRDIKQKIGFATPSDDAESLSNYYVYKDNNNNYRQIWYDDSLSLAKKYDWVLEKKLGGVGIWALGYDNGYPHLWQALGAKFGGGIAKKPTAKTAINAGFLTRLVNPVARLFTQPKMALQGRITFFASFLALFGSIGVLLYSLYRYSCHFSRMFVLILRGSVVALLLLLVYVIVLGFSLADDNLFFWLFIGIFIGAFILILLVRNYISDRQLP
jgi:spore germination protein YaaH